MPPVTMTFRTLQLADADADGKSAWFVIYTPHTGAFL